MSDPVAPAAPPAADPGGAPPAPPSAPAPAPPASLDPAVMYPGQGDPANPTPPAAPDPATPPAGDPPPADSSGFLSEKDGAPKEGDSPPAAPTPFDVTAIKVKEGFEIPAPTLEAFAGIAKEAGLSTEAAQKLIDLQISSQESALQESRDIIIAQDKEWKATLEADPLFAGAAGVAAKATIASMVEQFGSPEVVQVFDAYGLSNHPALVRWITKMGQALSEGRPTSPGTPRVNGGVTPAASGPLPNRLYPAHYNESGQPK